MFYRTPPTCGFFRCMFMMESQRQEQNPIINFAVPFLKMFKLYMLLKAHRIFKPSVAFIKSWFGNRRCPKKSEYSFTFGYKSGWKKRNILTSELYKVTKTALSSQRKFETHVYRIVNDHYQNFLKDWCKDARVRVIFCTISWAPVKIFKPIFCVETVCRSWPFWIW